MPIYEYICRECGHEIEQLQRMSDDALTECPDCGQAALKRKVSAAGFRLSGGGWYETDFKSDGRRNLTASDAKSESSDSGGKNDGKSDSKTADGKADKKKSGDTAKSGDSGSNKQGAKKADTGSGNKTSSA